MTTSHSFVPTQAAQLRAADEPLVLLYTPEWTDTVHAVLSQRPDAYEAHWRFEEDERAHVLAVAYDDGPRIDISFVDGVHNKILSLIARGAAVILSANPLFAEEGKEEQHLFTPEESIVLPKLPPVAV